MDKYAEHSFHLTEATRKSAPERIIWSDVMYDEFYYLKDSICSIPSLTLPLPSDSFVLQTDASQVGLGAVLRVQRDGEELPVALKLLPRERRYSATELEGLAVVTAIDHFSLYLITHPLLVETDHRALAFLNTAHHSNGRLARWAMRLQHTPLTSDTDLDPRTRMPMLSPDWLRRMAFLLQTTFSQLRGGGGGRCEETSLLTWTKNYSA